MIVELLGYAPDADPSLVGVLTACTGVVPSHRGLQGAPSPATTPLASLGATCQGAATLFNLDGTSRMFAATPKKIYEAATSTWTDVSRAATYTTSATGRWRFAQQGNVAFAANGADTIQASVSSGAFSCIAGAPVATIVETVGKFVFALNISGSPSKIQWSALNDYTSWTASSATQAGNDTLNGTPGAITAGRKFGSGIIVYKKNSMFFGRSVGAPTVWEFDQIPGDVGALSQEAVVNIGTPENPKHIFMGENDFYMFDGSTPKPIGTNRLKKTIFGAMLASRYYTAAALHDRANSRVYFWYSVADSVNPDKCVVYNYKTDRWGVDDRQIQFPFEYISPGITYNGLGGYYATYNDLPNLDYDSAFLNSSSLKPAFFDTNNNLRTLTGAAGQTSLTTGDLGSDERFATITRIRPRFITKPTSATWTHQHRNNLGETVTSNTQVSLSSRGTFDLMRDARWHRGTMALVGDWEMAVMSADFVESGLE